MAKQRLPNPVMYTPKTERETPTERKLDLSPCLVCHGPVDTGYYGRWGNGGVCSKKCNTVQEDVQKPEHVPPAA